VRAISVHLRNMWTGRVEDWRPRSHWLPVALSPSYNQSRQMFEPRFPGLLNSPPVGRSIGSIVPVILDRQLKQDAFV
jgi:hypothetical protein